MIKVSVIIPNFNRTTLLQEAIVSVLHQTFQSFEIIVVDDMSEIDPAPFINELNDSRIQLIRLPQKGNGSVARNFGAKIAKGEYIAFLDSDDEWYPNHLQVRIDLINSQPGIDGIYGAAELYNDSILVASPKVRNLNQGEFMLDYLLSGRLKACTPSLFFKREPFLNIMFDDSLFQHQDYDLNIRFATKYRYECVHMPTVKVKTFTTESSMGKNVIHESMQQFINQYAEQLSKKNLIQYIVSKALNYPDKKVSYLKILEGRSHRLNFIDKFLLMLSRTNFILFTKIFIVYNHRFN